ncbi:MAG: transcriptional regulator [Betaproteobacteria bacterium RIFCSPLOWO2_12_FULL_65_14]|nr:MAG: transcriptional regulator [Betaproteobacteria bacterium RIFCSPLOWO2_12_FULL_65_14]
MKLQQNTLLALYSALEFAADPERQISAAEIAAKYRISPHHLAKVLRRLGRAGLLHAARGVGGGYRFAGNPKRITLMDVIELFEEIGARPTGRGARREEERTLEQILGEIDEIAKATFRSITLDTMLKLLARRRA